MPKEYVGAQPGNNTTVIAWGVDSQTVQIATVSATRRVSHTIPTDVLETGMSPAEIETTAEHEPFDGWYVDLDREAINRLIRVLRRARDKSFGTDA